MVHSELYKFMGDVCISSAGPSGSATRGLVLLNYCGCGVDNGSGRFCGLALGVSG
jgi:hypothetical protein